jgi:Recombination endonuclease VII
MTVKRIRNYNGEKDKAHSRKWRKEHPKYYTSYLKEYHKKWRANKKAMGLCIRCGKNKAAEGRSGCDECRRHRYKTSVSRLFKLIRPEDHEKLTLALAVPNKRCGICGSTEYNGKGWHVDHCHKTGKFRAILCGTCNVGLGQFKDNISTLKSAIKYLEKFKNA